MILAMLIIGLLVLAVPSASAQESDGGDSPTAELPLVVTGDMSCTVVERGTRGTSDALVRGGTGARDQRLDCVHTMSDSRVSGTGPLTFNDDCFRGGCVMWGTNDVVAPDGRWECSWSGTGDPFGRLDGIVSGVCRGTGGYEGLTYMWQHAVRFTGKGDFGGDTNMYGHVYEGPPPPPWGPSQALSE
jgi:hypothetical protein